LQRSALSTEEIKRIDTDYESFREARVTIAHPTCLFGEDECDHVDCSKPDLIAKFIKTQLSLNRSKQRTVDLCLQACHAAAALSGKEIL